MKPINFKIIFLLVVIWICKENGVAQAGHVGINTSAPVAMLHVKDSSVLFTGPYGLPPNPGPPPVSGPGTRMMWYPAKAAFRVGEVTNSYWDRDSIGDFSVAMGLSSKAMGFGAFAVNGSSASGSYTSAFGQSSAKGNVATSFGLASQAIGNNSVAAGNNAEALGFSSFALGYHPKAVADYSFATGAYTLANDVAAFIVGSYNDTTNEATYERRFVVGNGTANTRSNALTVLYNARTGINTSVPKAMLHVVKDGLSGGTPNSSAGIVLENNNVAAINLLTPDASSSAIYFGNASNSAHGGIVYNSTTPYGLSFRTNGNSSKMVITDVGNVGIGESSPGSKVHISKGDSGGTPNSAAALTIEDDATVAINLLTPDGSASAVYFGNATNAVSGGVVYNSTTPNGLAFRTNGNSTKMVITNTGEVGIGTSTPTEKLHVNGNICYTGSIAACSDIRFKKNVSPIADPLNRLLALHGIYYDWDKEHFPDRSFDDQRQIGVSAQELEGVFPELVHTDEAGYKTVDYTRLGPVIIEAMKEQEKKIDQQQQQIDYLMGEMQKLKNEKNVVSNSRG